MNSTECRVAMKDTSEGTSDVLNRELYESYANLFHVYVRKLTEIFEGSTITTQHRIISDLEKICEAKGSGADQKFDGVTAKQVRLAAGLTTQFALCKKLRFTQTVCGLISKYESGRDIPKYPPRGKFPKAYLAWLKEQGYNPYGI